VRHFEEKYQITLTQLDTDGLPENAGYEMHEDYIMWHHWYDASEKIKKDIDALQRIVQQGISIAPEPSYVGGCKSLKNRLG